MLWHCGHSDRAGADIFMFGALLESLFAFDVFRFGTAMLSPPRIVLTLAAR
jgi:hypothetical protein